MKIKNICISILTILSTLLIITGTGCKDDLSCEDVDGNKYSAVVIGDQTWMAENLKTTKYRNKSAIPKVEDDADWQNQTSGAYSHYNNNEGTGNTYGALYNWYAVESGKLCPEGWHVPSKDEWSVLIKHLGGNTVAGGHLKETGTAHWTSPNAGATNSTGFNALPGGERLNDGTFEGLKNKGYWWSASEANETYAWGWLLLYGYEGIGSYDNDKKNGFSVRCVKD
jgi:uncharacterized protein (TIGR02145 family)